MSYQRMLLLALVLVSLPVGPAWAGRLSSHLGRAADTATPTRSSLHKLNRTGFVTLSVRSVAGREQVYASVISPGSRIGQENRPNGGTPSGCHESRIALPRVTGYHVARPRRGAPHGP